MDAGDEQHLMLELLEGYEVGEDLFEDDADRRDVPAPLLLSPVPLQDQAAPPVRRAPLTPAVIMPTPMPVPTTLTKPARRRKKDELIYLCSLMKELEERLARLQQRTPTVQPDSATINTTDSASAITGDPRPCGRK